MTKLDMVLKRATKNKGFQDEERKISIRKPQSEEEDEETRLTEWELCRKYSKTRSMGQD